MGHHHPCLGHRGRELTSRGAGTGILDNQRARRSISRRLHRPNGPSRRHCDDGQTTVATLARPREAVWRLTGDGYSCAWSSTIRIARSRNSSGCLCPFGSDGIAPSSQEKEPSPDPGRFKASTLPPQRECLTKCLTTRVGAPGNQRAGACTGSDLHVRWWRGQEVNLRPLRVMSAPPASVPIRRSAASSVLVQVATSRMLGPSRSVRVGVSSFV